jgi:hypothetical protein
MGFRESPLLACHVLRCSPTHRCLPANGGDYWRHAHRAVNWNYLHRYSSLSEYWFFLQRLNSRQQRLNRIELLHEPSLKRYYRTCTDSLRRAHSQE